jgi:teichuronic acid biosynthesis glycosyltransferase TuaC
MRVAVVSEFYPRATDPVLGVWAHRQAMAARDAGADVRVLVLHRPIPPLRTLREGPRAAAAAARELLRQPRRAELDGLQVEYVPFVSPPRPRTYGTWGSYAAPSIGIALRRLRRSFAFDLVHAHNAVPAGEAVRRARISAPLVVSVHGGDVFHTGPGS